MINAIGTYIGHFKRTFDGDSIRDLSNTVQFLEQAPTETTWRDSTGNYTAPSNHQWEGSCYDFDGVDDYVDMGAVNLTGYLTISLWFKSSTAPSIDYRLLCSRDGSGNGIDFYINANGSVSFYNSGGAGQSTIIDSFSGDWVHLVCVIDGADSKFYKNGSDVTSTVPNTTVSSTSENLILGRYSSVAIRHFNGSIFDLRIFDKALTTSEITDLYNHKVNVATSNLVAHYKMDETSGTTAFDSSGNDNHGTITNATLSTFHSTQNRYSFANTVGYTDSSGVRIPCDESDTGNDVQGNPLGYAGRVKYDAQLVESHCGTFDGVNDVVDLGVSAQNVNEIDLYLKIDTSETHIMLVASATFQLYWNGGKFYLYSGSAIGNCAYTLEDKFVHIHVILNDGSNSKITVDGVELGSFSAVPSLPDVDLYLMGHNTSPGTWAGNAQVYRSILKDDNGDAIQDLVFSEGSGTTIHDISVDGNGGPNGNHGKATNITESSFWGSTQDKVHWNLTKGFSDVPVLTKDSGSGWDAGAESDWYSGDIILKWYPKINKTQMVGLNNQEDTGYSFGDIENAVYTYGTTISGYDGGVGIGVVGSFAEGDYLRLEKVGSVGKLYKNDETTSLHTFATSLNTDVKVDVAINTVGAKIYAFVDGVPVEWQDLSTNTSMSYLKIPALASANENDALGNPLTNPAGAWHNNAETKIKQHNAPALLQADETDDFWFNSSDVAQAKSYSDLVDDVGNNHHTMADVSTSNQIKNISIFDPALASPDLEDVQEFLNH